MDAFFSPPMCAEPCGPSTDLRPDWQHWNEKGSQGTTALNESVISPRRPTFATTAFLLDCSTSVPGSVTFLPQASLFSGSIRNSSNLSALLKPESVCIISSHPRAALSSRVQTPAPRGRHLSSSSVRLNLTPEKHGMLQI